MNKPISLPPEVAKRLNLKKLTEGHAILGLFKVREIKTFSDGLRESLQNIPDNKVMHVVINPKGFLEVVVATEDEANKYAQDNGWQLGMVH